MGTWVPQQSVNHVDSHVTIKKLSHTTGIQVAQSRRATYWMARVQFQAGVTDYISQRPRRLRNPVSLLV